MLKKIIDIILSNNSIKVRNKRLKRALRFIKIVNAFIIEVAKIAMSLFVISIFVGGIFWVAKQTFI